MFSLLDLVFRFRRVGRLPLHMFGLVRAAAPQRNEVVHHVARANRRDTLRMLLVIVDSLSDPCKKGARRGRGVKRGA